MINGASRATGAAIANRLATGGASVALAYVTGQALNVCADLELG